MFGVMIQLLPRKFGDPDREPVLHHEVFLIEEAAEEYRNDARRKNYPFKQTWVISFEDPRT